MPLIKAQSAPAGARPFSMSDIETAAKRILLRARQQADALLGEAQVEAEALRQQSAAQGRSEGHAEGYQQGLEQGQVAGHEQALGEYREQLAQTIEALTTALSEVEASRQALQSQALSEVIQLAIAIARRVTKRQGELDPLVLESNLCQAMKMVSHSADLRIAVHPSQQALLEDLLIRLKMQWPILEHAQLVNEQDIAPGGCRVYARSGLVDADLSAQLDHVVADLLPSSQRQAL